MRVEHHELRRHGDVHPRDVPSVRGPAVALDANLCRRRRFPLFLRLGAEPLDDGITGSGPRSSREVAVHRGLDHQPPAFAFLRGAFIRLRLEQRLRLRRFRLVGGDGARVSTPQLSLLRRSRAKRGGFDDVPFRRQHERGGNGERREDARRGDERGDEDGKLEPLAAVVEPNLDVDAPKADRDGHPDRTLVIHLPRASHVHVDRHRPETKPEPERALLRQPPREEPRDPGGRGADGKVKLPAVFPLGALHPCRHPTHGTHVPRQVSLTVRAQLTLHPDLEPEPALRVRIRVRQRPRAVFAQLPLHG